MSTFFKELFGLFVDDGSLAIAILAWCAVAGLAVHAAAAPAPWQGPVLFIGCAMILVVNVAITARRRR